MSPSRTCGSKIERQAAWRERLARSASHRLRNRLCSSSICCKRASRLHPLDQAFDIGPGHLRFAARPAGKGKLHLQGFQIDHLATPSLLRER